MSPPECYAYFLEYKDKMRYTQCDICKNAFSPTNVHTRDGWKETQISGLCEDCFDALTRE